MNKHIYIAGVSALALALAALPALALAENSGGGEDSAVAQVGIQTQGENVSGNATASNEAAREQQKQNAEVSREQQKQQLEASSSNRIIGGEEMGEGQDEREMEGVPFRLESSTTPAFSIGELKQSIEVRKQELEQEAASSSSDADHSLMENVNPVRLAVHSLLASKDLLGGGIGQQVSDIAQHMNDAVATTTAAEAKIQSRGFLTRLFFGGDSASAQAISEAVAKNQANIQKLTDLINQAGTTADVKATLTAQITALEDAQTRLQALAQNEQKAWGLFSWRF